MQPKNLILNERFVKPDSKSCYHCGQPCDEDVYSIEDKSFCCYGCKTVYEILLESNLCEYYDFQKTPGVRLESEQDDAYTYLDEEAIRNRIVLFDVNGITRVRLYVPAIHCISCIWLLENLNKFALGILKSEVNFTKKIVFIDFDSNRITLSEVAKLIASIGYKPVISLGNDNKPEGLNSTLLIQLAIAGFCFGNIMMLSFPEYLGIDQGDYQLKKLFSYLNILLGLPVIFYSGKDYFISAWRSFKQKQINIDVPIAIGILVLFIRSIADILLQLGPGYMDSMTGLVFLLLIGRWFQNKTYESLAFDRDYKSYFPLAVFKMEHNEWKACLVNELVKGDHVRIRNKEIVPADSLLLNDDVYIDYSFVTGESKPVKLMAGNLVYAGGRVVGKSARMTIQKESSQSHLTSLWNNDAFQKPEENNFKSLIDKVAKVFTWSVLIIAFSAGLYWYWFDASRVWLIVTAVLMVACPCALALAAPFTYGSMLRVFGNHGLYLKNADVVENMASINAVVFDKTGTLTHGSSHITWNGQINDKELQYVKSVTSSSTHPLSELITKAIKGNVIDPPEDFYELPGEGVEGKVGDVIVRIGSSQFVADNDNELTAASRVYVSIDGHLKGYFEVATRLRHGIHDLVKSLGSKVKALLSGDGPSDKEKMNLIFQQGTIMSFSQTAQDKLNYISSLQKQGDKVMMIGDGLNDSGALKQSNVGIAVSDDTGLFTPSCDGILSGSKLENLDRFLSLSQYAMLVLKLSLVISLIYNVFGLGFAITGYLTPLVAAILMPISSISVVAFTTFMVNFRAKKVFA